MNLVASLEKLYPNAPKWDAWSSNNPWDIRDDGKGPFIAQWNYSEPQPSDEEILSAWRLVLKDLQWERIKARRDAVKAGGVKVGTKWFHTDEASRIQHMALNVMGSGIPANLQWKTMDGTFVSMTQTLAGQVFQAVATLDMTAFAKAEEHRVAMEAAADPSAYDFSTGWPQTYAETLVP